MSRALSLPRSQPAVPSEKLDALVHGAGPEAFARLASERTVTTPFQATGWIAAFLEAHGMSEDFRLIELRDNAGNALLLPLVLQKQAGVRCAVKIGGAHASYFLPAMIGDIDGWRHDDICTALMQAGTSIGVDAFLLADCPLIWDGKPNPLDFLAIHPAPDDGAMLTLDPDAEALLCRLSDRDARKKLRQKSGKLAAIGPLAFGWAVEPEAALALYFRWKAVQFSTQGIRDTFATPEIRRFLRQTTSGAAPVIRLYALTAGDRMLAVLGGVFSAGASNRHFSGMFTAYDPEVARHSPGEILVAGLVHTLAHEGVRSFDLGVGEARYKAHYCPEPIPLVDVALPVTGFGKVVAGAWYASRRLKRFVKRNTALFGLLKRARRRLVT